MNRLQTLVDTYTAKYRADHGGTAPDFSDLLDGPFSRQTGVRFCLCLSRGTGAQAMVTIAGLSCAKCQKPVTAETYEYFDEAVRDRTAAAREPGGNGSG